MRSFRPCWPRPHYELPLLLALGYKQEGLGSGLGLSFGLNLGLGLGLGLVFGLLTCLMLIYKVPTVCVRECVCVCAKGCTQSRSKAVASSCPRLYLKMDNVLLYYTQPTANDALARRPAQDGTLD